MQTTLTFECLRGNRFEKHDIVLRSKNCQCRECRLEPSGIDVRSVLVKAEVKPEFALYTCGKIPKYEVSAL